MPDNFVVQKRLLGKEDCNFDLNGTAETASFIGSDGNALTVKKINAGHLPILAALRTKVGDSVEVNAALDFLADAIAGIGDASPTAKGLIELATLVETQTGTDALRAITPQVLAALVTSETAKGIVQMATAAEVEAGSLTNKAVSPANLPPPGVTGRLVKFLTTSGTLTINESADDSIASYLTSNDIKSGTYIVYAYGAGGGGAELVGYMCGAGGGCSRGILTISSSTAYTIGAGGTGSSTPTAGGDTIISSLTGGGGGVSIVRYEASTGGTGNYKIGQSGSSDAGGIGGGDSGGGSNVTSIPGIDGGLASGGGGSSPSYAAGDGGDGYIEIHEWSI